MTPDHDPTPLTPAVFHVLLALSDGPLHGYGIMKRIERESGERVGPGTVYGTLQRMEAAGLVRDEGPDPSDTRTRTLFAVTDFGREAFRAEARRLARLVSHPGVRSALAEGGP